MTLTLTVAEIKDLAEFAGLTMHSRFLPSDDEMEAEITIADAPPEGVNDDENVLRRFKRVAYFTEYPEEGCAPLGPELTPNVNSTAHPAA